MTAPEKKFTFGFSKVVKKSNLVVPPPSLKGKSDGVQFIDCLEEKAIKLRQGEEEEEKGPLIIPLIGPRKSSTLVNGKSIAEAAEDFSELDKNNKGTQESTPIDVGSASSLDAIAIKEILQEASGVKVQEESQSLETLPNLESADRERLQRESTLEDYENVPVSQFGLAMLRGMGWKPGEGIGKNCQLIPVTVPAVRPKGLGLGADKVAVGTPSLSTTSGKKDEEDLKVVKGACIKILSGSHRGQYAVIEGFTDDSGRAVVKLAIGGRTVSVSEASIQPVSKIEYNQFSKVLNADKFEEFKRSEGEVETTGRTTKNISQEPSKSKLSLESESPHQSTSKKSVQMRSHSPSPNPHIKNEPKSSSESPERSRKDSRRRRHRDRSRSPHHKRKGDKGFSMTRKTSVSPRRERHISSVSVSGDGKYCKVSHNQDKSKHSSDSDNSLHGSDSRRRKKDRDRVKQRYSSSDSGEVSPYQSSRKKKKGKKSRRSHSRSPSRRRRR